MLDRQASVLVVIDVQEGYRGLTVAHERMQRGVQTLIRAAAVFGLPVIATEQYPKGIGHLVPEVAALLPEGTPVVEKMTMSCCAAPEFVERLRATGRRQVVVCGIEAHACVNQTVHELLDLGFGVHVPWDALSSRFEHDCRVGWEKMIGSGAVPTTVEMTCLEWVRTAAAPEFKQIHRLIK
jgi:nicotinamidase-related amidase